MPEDNSSNTSDAMPKDWPEAPKDILEPEGPVEPYEPSDIFAWANNIRQYQEQLKIELFLFNKRGVMYRTKLTKDLDVALAILFVDELVAYVLNNVDAGLVVRGFEEGDAEENVLQRVQLSKVQKAVELMNWLKTQEAETEIFVEGEHDLKRIKGLMARCSHPNMPKPFYVVKALPQGQVLKGDAAWMIREGRFMPFDADAALKIPPDNQLLILDQDIFVFNQAKLNTIFGYNAKSHTIAQKRIEEIAKNFSLTIDENLNLAELVQGNKALVNKLQKLENISELKQEQLMEHAEELGLSLMRDDSGNIIIMDEKDLRMFVNLLNDDYIESNLTGQRYEIQRKKPLKIKEDNNSMDPSDMLLAGS